MSTDNRAPPGPGSTTEPLAVASLVCSVLGLVVAPFVGAAAGAALGVAALGKLRRMPGRQGRGIAVAGTVVGVVGLVPLAVIALIERSHWSSVPFALTIAYLGVVLTLLWRQTAGRERTFAAAGFAGGLGLVAVAAVVSYLVAVLFVDGVILLLRNVDHQIACSVRRTVHSSQWHCPPLRRRH